MIIGTVFTLFVVPSIYMLVAKTRSLVTADEFAEDEATYAAPAARAAGAPAN